MGSPGAHRVSDSPRVFPGHPRAASGRNPSWNLRVLEGRELGATPEYDPDGGHVRRRWRDFPMLHGVDFGRSAFVRQGMPIQEWDNDGQVTVACPSSPPSGSQITTLLAPGVSLKETSTVINNV